MGATTPSDSAPTSTAAATTPAAAAAGPATAANTAARCSGRTSRRNPDCPADHHAHRGDPPNSYTAECATASGDQSPDDGRGRLFTADRHPNRPNPGSNC